jgi:hypothetical protein
MRWDGDKENALLNVLGLLHRKRCWRGTEQLVVDFVLEGQSWLCVCRRKEAGEGGGGQNLLHCSCLATAPLRSGSGSLHRLLLVSMSECVLHCNYF